MTAKRASTRRAGRAGRAGRGEPAEPAGNTAAPKKKPPQPPTASAEAPPPKYEPKYNWMNKSKQWGMRVRPGKAGLKLGDLNVGVYGEVPMRWADEGRNPRGAVPRRGMPPVGYAVRDKADLWAPSAADLYEEAIARRWIPATDVPWHTIEPLPDEVEHAVCQVCTELVSYANVDIEAITGWQHRMAYGYHEVKQFLAAASFDAARHFECFRKRALVNGGGLGLEGPGRVNRLILESRGGWTEAVVYLFLLRGVFTMTLYKHLERHAHNDAERFLYGHALADKARHVAYGVEHLQFAIAHVDDQRQIVATLFAFGDGGLSHDLRDPVLREALAILFGGGVARARQRGLARYGDFLRDFVATHLALCRYLDVARDPARLPVPLNEYAPAQAAA